MAPTDHTLSVAYLFTNVSILEQIKITLRIIRSQIRTKPKAEVKNQYSEIKFNMQLSLISLAVS